MMRFKRLLAASLVAMLSTYSLAQMQPLDSVAVIVNDGVILQSDIENSVRSVRVNAQREGQALPADEILTEQVVEKLIMDELQAQEAARIGVRINDQRLDEAIANIAQGNNQTLAELQQSVAAEGLSYADYREQVREEVASSEARNALVRRRISILPAEVENLSQLLAAETNKSVQYRIEHIQLRFSSDRSKEEVEAQATDLLTQLEQGADFAELAITYSKGPKALQGGDWGWLRKEEMPTIFADEIALQGKGDIIGPFRSGAGFHLLKIKDVQGLETVAVTEVNARHILIKTSVILSDDGAKQQLDKFVRQINSGETSFAELAQQFSADPGSAARDGELGYQTPDLYVPEFKHQVETLPVGVISEPFKTVHGWHIVEVLDRREVDRTDAALSNRAYRILLNRKFNEEVTAWLQELRASAYIEFVTSEE